MTKDEIIKKLRDMAKYPTVMMPRDCEALKAAADFLAQPSTWQGLTLGEAVEIWTKTEQLDVAIKLVEAKLKEKNT